MGGALRRDGAESLPLKGGGWRPTGPAFGRPDDRLREEPGIHNHRLGVWIPGPPQALLSQKDADQNHHQKRMERSGSA